MKMSLGLDSNTQGSNMIAQTYEDVGAHA